MSYAAVEDYGISGFVLEVFDDLDKVGAGVVLHGCRQSSMPNPVEGLLGICEDMVCLLYTSPSPRDPT